MNNTGSSPLCRMIPTRGFSVKARSLDATSTAIRVRSPRHSRCTVADFVRVGLPGILFGLNWVFLKQSQMLRGVPPLTRRQSLTQSESLRPGCGFTNSVRACCFPPEFPSLHHPALVGQAIRLSFWPRSLAKSLPERSLPFHRGFPLLAVWHQLANTVSLRHQGTARGALSSRNECAFFAVSLVPD
jgi:hypothetical protein